jgi:hypothetical protein
VAVATSSEGTVHLQYRCATRPHQFWLYCSCTMSGRSWLVRGTPWFWCQQSPSVPYSPGVCEWSRVRVFSFCVDRIRPYLAALCWANAPRWATAPSPLLPFCLRLCLAMRCLCADNPTPCMCLWPGRRKKGPLAGIPDEAAEAAAKPRAAAKPQARNSSSVAASPRPLQTRKKRWGGGVPPPAPPPRKELPRFARKPRLRRREGLRPFPAP